MAFDELISREDIQNGLPARRAQSLLSYVESKVAYIISQNRQELDDFSTDEALAERDLAFLEATTLARRPPVKPSIQDLERYCSSWANLVPENPRLRAAFANLLGQNYRFNFDDIPRIRTAIGFDDVTVRLAYLRLYNVGPEKIFSVHPRFGDRMAWLWRGFSEGLDKMPPFLVAFFLSLVSTISVGVLVLPIAVASLGLFVGLLIMGGLGLLNVYTVVSIAESASRSLDSRYHSGFLGRLVKDFLGKFGELSYNIGLFFLSLMALGAYFIGFGESMSDLVTLPSWVWGAVLLVIVILSLWRRPISNSVSVTLMLGAVSLVLLGGLMITAAFFQRPNQPSSLDFTPSISGLAVGIIAFAFFGHTTVSNCARVVLRRSKTTRPLIYGTIFGQLFVIALYFGWTLLVYGVTGPEALVASSGTALMPLTDAIGWPVGIASFVLTLVVMGLGASQLAATLARQIKAIFPSQSRHYVMLARRKGRLLFYHPEDPNAPRFGLSYMGLDNDIGQFRLDVQIGYESHRVEFGATEHWDSFSLIQRYPQLRDYGVEISFDIQDESPEYARLQIISTVTGVDYTGGQNTRPITPMLVAYKRERDNVGPNLSDVLTLQETEQKVINWVMRQGEVKLSEMVAYLSQTPEKTVTLLDSLVDRGFIREIESDDEPRFRTRFQARRSRQLVQDLAQVLMESPETPPTIQGYTIERLDQIINVAPNSFMQPSYAGVVQAPYPGNNSTPAMGMPINYQAAPPTPAMGIPINYQAAPSPYQPPAPNMAGQAPYPPNAGPARPYVPPPPRPNNVGPFPPGYRPPTPNVSGPILGLPVGSAPVGATPPPQPALPNGIMPPAGMGRQAVAPPPKTAAPMGIELNLGQRQKFLLGFLPIIFVFVVAESLMVLDSVTFPSALGMTGFFFVPLLAWIIPALLLTSSQRKGEAMPDLLWQLLGFPVISCGIGVFTGAVYFFHSIVLWQHPAGRATAFLFGLAAIVATIFLARYALIERIIVELRDDRRKRARDFFAITVGGKPALSDVRLLYPEGEQQHENYNEEVQEIARLKSAIFQLPPTNARQLRIRTYAIAPEYDTESLPAILELHNNAGSYRFDVTLTGGTFQVGYDGEPCVIEVKLPFTPSS